METMIGAIFVVAMLILAVALLYFVLRGAGVAADTAEEVAVEERADEHRSEPDAIVTPPASGLLMDEIDEGEHLERAPRD